MAEVSIERLEITISQLELDPDRFVAAIAQALLDRISAANSSRQTDSMIFTINARPSELEGELATRVAERILAVESDER